jgi:hypothetical protein
LLQVERGWRDMKTILELRPVYHRLEDRIRAHVLLCWLALLLIRAPRRSSISGCHAVLTRTNTTRLDTGQTPAE